MKGGHMMVEVAFGRSQPELWTLRENHKNYASKKGRSGERSNTRISKTPAKKKKKLPNLHVSCIILLRWFDSVLMTTYLKK